MLEFLQTFSRAILAVLSGAMLIYGSMLFADTIGGTGSAFQWAMVVLGQPELKIISTVMMAVTAYILGIINVAGSSVAFRSLATATEDDLLLISRIESLQRPQVMKEVIELLNVKRTLVGFTFPLFYFGVALACDRGEWPASPMVPMSGGLLLVIMAGLALVFAVRIVRVLDAIAIKLLATPPNHAMQRTAPRSDV